MSGDQSCSSPLASSSGFTFFDPNDPACLEILMDPRTTVPELFAIVRQWVPQVQHKIDVIGNEVRRRGAGPVQSSTWEGAGPVPGRRTRVSPERRKEVFLARPSALTSLSAAQILKRGCHVNDRDGLTDMTLLHYSCKAGAHGVGERRRHPPDGSTQRWRRANARSRPRR